MKNGPFAGSVPQSFINTTMALAYWLIGRRIVVEEQKGSKRAAYGERLLERISRELSSEFGNGFGEPHLRNCRLFYKAYPTESEIRYALRIKLSWSHHRLIMRVPEPEVKYSIMAECERIFATKLMPFLPTKAELQCEIERSCRRTNLKKRSDKPTRPAIGRS